MSGADVAPERVALDHEGYANVVVPLGTWAAAEIALAPAAEVARLFGARLHLLSVGIEEAEADEMDRRLAILAGPRRSRRPRLASTMATRVRRRMGAWGKEPWANDTAADFFGDLWEGTPIVDRVLAALDSSEGDETMAALWLCSELCRVYVWPIDRLDETLARAVAAADRLLAGEDEGRLLELWDDEEVTGQVRRFREILATRQRGPG